ncbi:GTPase [Cellulomonas sp. 73-145]|uniref:GTPase n=1 Tax=Cellulomonas sp. 73-145 TaxID=1895739 RepID=UPI0025C0D170|nr:GTPase [Cellulomonas sp. 73-145]
MNGTPALPDQPLPAPAGPAVSPDATSTLQGEQTAALRRRADALEEAVRRAGERVDPEVAEQVLAVLGRVRERLLLGVDHTVVALAGGTGSGKSSLFNAVAGLQFAEVGVRRPTTSRVTACVWGMGSGPLLQWLGVDPDDRIERESLLDGEHEAALRGLVLLDLPDHDSVSPEHRAVVDRVLPQADMLVWVVDPQKYADDALHAGYLRRLVGHEAAMAVLLNQVDTVQPALRDGLAADVERLLVEDGLRGVPVRQVSARTGEGVQEVRTELARTVAQRSLAARRADAELDGAARLLSGQLAPAEPEPARLAVAPVVETLAAAVGLDAVADAVAALVRGATWSAPTFGPVPLDSVAQARSGWIEHATAGLPARWARDVHERVATDAELGLALTDALAGVTVTARRSRWAAALTALAVLLGLAAVIAAAVGLGEWLGGRSVDGWALPSAAATALAAVLARLGATAVRRAAAGRRAAAVVADGRASIEGTARARLVVPAQQVIAEHRRTRELVASARSLDD